MMEPRFKAWHYGNKKMYDVINISFDLQTDTNLDISSCIFVTLNGIPYEQFNIKYKPSPIKLIRYTGLRDKDNIKIWENDLVKLDGDPDTFYEIVYKNGRFACTLNKGIDTFGFSHYATDIVNDARVFGNVFVNPELLEVVND